MTREEERFQRYFPKNPRIDDNTVFRAIWIGSNKISGPWCIRRTLGDLAYAGSLMVTNGKTAYRFEQVEEFELETM